MKTILFPRQQPLSDPALQTLKAELADAQEELAFAYHQFNQAVDPELVESCIFQISAVKARCNYLIRAVKARCPTEAAALAAEKEDATWT